ncbi:hypothetical protein BDW66DRAFT_153301 [Aspergillus desertorum]
MQTMHQHLKNVHCDITRLHGQEEALTTLTAARGLGIKIRRIEQPPSSSDRAVPFKPCFFLPPKAVANSEPKSKRGRRGKKDKHYRRCVNCALTSCAADSSTSPLSSTSASPSRPSRSVHLRASSSFSLARSSCCSSFVPSTWTYEEGSALGAGGGGENEEGTDGGPRYPYMVKSVAEMQGLPQPCLPKTARKAVLTANGPVMKGKYRQDQAVALHENAKWKVTQVFEDTTYTQPHAIVELCVNSRCPTDGSFLTACEVRAILRLMKLRIEMSQYHDHACLPVLALSYIASNCGDKVEYRSGRILQAHHDGRHLVIQYSQRHDFHTAELASSSFDKFFRYYFSEPVRAGVSQGMKDEGEPWRLLQWRRVNKRLHNSSDGDDCSVIEANADRLFRRWFKKRMVLVR